MCLRVARGFGLALLFKTESDYSLKFPQNSLNPSTSPVSNFITGIVQVLAKILV